MSTTSTKSTKTARKLTPEECRELIDAANELTKLATEVTAKFAALI